MRRTTHQHLCIFRTNRWHILEDMMLLLFLLQSIKHAVSTQALYSVTYLQVIEGTAKLHGCIAELKWSDQAYIPTVNDAKLVSLVEEAAGKLVGIDRWHRLAEPTMAAEDFGFLAGPSPANAFAQGTPCLPTCALLL